MAVYNEIQVGRFNRFLQKLLSMKGPASMNTLAPELMPVLPLQRGLEDLLLEGFERFGILIEPAAPGVANNAGVRLRNPAGSNVIAVIESVTIAPSVNDIIRISFGKTNVDLALPIVQSGNNFDGRGRPQSTLSLSVTSASTALSAGTNIGYMQLAAAINGEWIQDASQGVTLTPGWAISFSWNSTNAAGGEFGCKWRERALEDSERA